MTREAPLSNSATCDCADACMYHVVHAGHKSLPWSCSWARPDHGNNSSGSMQQPMAPKQVVAPCMRRTADAGNCSYRLCNAAEKAARAPEWHHHLSSCQWRWHADWNVDMVTIAALVQHAARSEPAYRCCQNLLTAQQACTRGNLPVCCSRAAAIISMLSVTAGFSCCQSQGEHVPAICLQPTVQSLC